MRTPSEKIADAFKRFYIALKHADKHAAIRPYYVNDANRVPSISASTQVQNPDHLDLSRYHKGRYTSTTHVNNQSIPSSDGQNSSGTVQTRAQSVVIYEQYEQRFVHVEQRLTTVENTINRSANMIERLLVFNGINMTDEPSNEQPSASAPMEVENNGNGDVGRKRICHSMPDENSQRVSQNCTHA